MSTPAPVTAFVSYSHIDFDAHSALRALLVDLEKMTHSADGERRLKLWRDAEVLDWGDDWRKRLFRALDQAEFFLIFLSRGWILSSECRAEWKDIQKREKELGGERVFVAKLHDIDESDRRITDEMRGILAELRRPQILDWSSLLRADTATQEEACWQAGESIARKLRSLPVAPQPDPARPPAHSARPAPARERPPVSGSLHVPTQDDFGTQATVRLTMTFAGPCKVVIEEGEFVYQLTSAWLRVEAARGVMEKHPQFLLARCRAKVTPKDTGLRHQEYLIEAIDGAYLDGAVLAPDPNDITAPLVLVDRIDGAPAPLSGFVEIDLDCVDIDNDRSTPQSPEHADIIGMKKQFAALIVKKAGKRFALETE